KVMDLQIGEILESVKQAGWWDDTLIIMVTNHGGKEKSMEEVPRKRWKYFMAVYFTEANSNSDITSGRENGKLFNMDCAVIILEALGIEVPKYSDAISPYISC
ncbi:1859_t:CDS:1, partial [Racocetra persica]